MKIIPKVSNNLNNVPDLPNDKTGNDNYRTATTDHATYNTISGAGSSGIFLANHFSAVDYIYIVYTFIAF